MSDRLINLLHCLILGLKKGILPANDPEERNVRLRVEQRVHGGPRDANAVPEVPLR